MFFSRELHRTIRRWTKEIPFTAGIASASSVASYLNPLMDQGKRTVVDLVDVDSEKWLEYAEKSAFPKSRLYRLEGHRLRRVETKLAQSADAVTLVSEAEVNLFRQRVSSTRVHAVTNGVDLDYFQPQEFREPRRGCVFVGAMDYRPNVDAVVWFVREIWPQIRERFPEHPFRIVGRNPTSEVLNLRAIPGVEVIGTVPDVREFVTRAAVSVAPLRIARGLQNKVLEAMAMGAAVVASPQALAGFRPHSNVPARVATLPAEWVMEISRFLTNPADRSEAGQAGRAYAERYHHWEACLEPLAELLQLPQPAGVMA